MRWDLTQKEKNLLEKKPLEWLKRIFLSRMKAIAKNMKEANIAIPTDTLNKQKEYIEFLASLIDKKKSKNTAPTGSKNTALTKMLSQKYPAYIELKKRINDATRDLYEDSQTSESEIIPKIEKVEYILRDNAPSKTATSKSEEEEDSKGKAEEESSEWDSTNEDEKVEAEERPRDPESSKTSWDEDDFTLPANIQGRRNKPQSANYFFAKTKKEYNERKSEVQDLKKNFEKHQEIVRRTTIQTSALETSVSTPEAIAKLATNIDAELQLMQKYKGLLQDLHRIHDGIREYGGNIRDPSFTIPPTLSKGEKTEDIKIRITTRIAEIEACISTLNTAQARLKNLKNLKDSAQRESAYYSKLQQGKVFKEANSATNKQNATQAAYIFLNEKRGQQQPGQPERLPLAAGEDTGFSTEANHTCRFIGTEVNTKPGKPSIPVGIVQETNTKQTYSDQTLHLLPADLKKLDSLPLL